VHVRLVYSSAAVVVQEVWCDDHPERRTAEEESAATQVILPHHGVFERHVEGRRVVGHPATAVFENLGEVGRIVHPTAGSDSSTVLTPSTAVLEALGDEHGRLPASSTPIDGETLLRHERLRREWGRAGTTGSAGGRITTTLAVDELALDLMVGVVRRPAEAAGASGRSRYRRIADDAVVALSEQLRESVGLVELAVAIGVSPFEVSRAVNRTFGRSIVEIRTMLRLRHVIEHLDDTGSELSGLAVDAGFADQAHMTRSFRRHTGHTPTDARRYLASVPRKIGQDDEGACPAPSLR
jgi:AraC-like DNA-binding protein